MSDPYVTPALSTSGQAKGAYEIKFLLENALADSVMAMGRRDLEADPHSDPALGDGYHVNSLYLDTPKLDTYRRSEGYRGRKYRLRRYGLSTTVMLERKSKRHGLVKKQRTPVPSAEVVHLVDCSSPEGWPGKWYYNEVKDRRLVPTCNVSYRRVARVGITPEGPIRLTVDRDLRITKAHALSVPRVVDGPILLDGFSIVEMKFCAAMPSVFKSIMYELGIAPQHVSKFRLSVETCHLVGSSTSRAV